MYEKDINTKQVKQLGGVRNFPNWKKLSDYLYKTHNNDDNILYLVK